MRFHLTLKLAVLSLFILLAFSWMYVHGYLGLYGDLAYSWLQIVAVLVLAFNTSNAKLKRMRNFRQDRGALFPLYILTVVIIMVSSYCVRRLLVEHTSSPSVVEMQRSVAELQRMSARVKTDVDKALSDFVRGYHNHPLAYREKSIDKLVAKGPECVNAILALLSEAQKQNQKELKADLIKALSLIMKADLSARYSTEMSAAKFEELKTEVSDWIKERELKK